MSLPLPSVQTVLDCASFNRTVLPFLPELTALPARLIEAGQDVEKLKAVYLSTNPLVTATGCSLALSLLFLVFSEITRNHSQVDRFWSILPAVYNAHFAIWARMTGLQTQKLDTVAIISAIWSARLTFNYWRKGGYKFRSEDYRWPVLRSKVNNAFVFFLFNVFFISLTQSLLLLSITAPTYAFVLLAQVKQHEQFGIPDLIFSRVIIIFVFIEAVADHQQWNFQCAKREYLQTARVPGKYKEQFSSEDLDRGFIVNGLWSWCRHPNFAAEQAIWVTLYLWACYCTETYVHWTGIGALGYLLLFQGSTRLTESITASKYPEYSDYQARVGKFIPRFSVEARGGKGKFKRSTSKKGTDQSKRDQSSEQKAGREEGKKMR